MKNQSTFQNIVTKSFFNDDKINLQIKMCARHVRNNAGVKKNTSED